MTKVAAILILPLLAAICLYRIQIQQSVCVGTEQGIKVDAESIRRLQYDRGAFVLLSAGPDGKPGRAGVDDGMPPNGVIDDRSELGAVPSDDQCLAPWQPGYEDAIKARSSAIISRGTFRPVENFDSEKPEDRRIMVDGLRDGEPTTWMVLDETATFTGR